MARATPIAADAAIDLDITEAAAAASAPDDVAPAAPVAAPEVALPTEPEDPAYGWFAATGPFPLIDAETGTRFVAGPLQRAKRSWWTKQHAVPGGSLREGPKP